MLGHRVPRRIQFRSEGDAEEAKEGSCIFLVTFPFTPTFSGSFPCASQNVSQSLSIGEGIICTGARFAFLLLNRNDGLNFDENAHGQRGDFDRRAGGFVGREVGGVDGVDLGEIAHRLEEYGSLHDVGEVAATRFHDGGQVLERLRLRSRSEE